MQTWEYQIVNADSDTVKEDHNGKEIVLDNGSRYPTVLDYLTQEGHKGWELAAAFTIGGDNVRLILKRPKGVIIGVQQHDLNP